MRAPRFVLAAPSSGSGKTTLAVGLMAAFAERITVQGYKVGPDYIDPGYHTAATGRASRNLDTWMVAPKYVKESFSRSQGGAGLSIIEGVMGLYDGYNGRTEAGSTAEVAKLLNAPVVLVIDAAKMARSAGAVALGFRQFDPQLNLAGVILNNTAGAAHAAWVAEAVRSVGITVLGCIPRNEALRVPERHLGLYTAGERDLATRQFIEAAKEFVRQHVALSDLETLALNAPEIQAAAQPPLEEPSVRIAVARDEAFCFYYEENFDLLRAAGAQLVFFSPLRDQCLPAGVSGLYLGGGYPELYAGQLAKNEAMRSALRAFVLEGAQTYAECGGLMTLAEYYVDEAGVQFPMAGVLPGFTRLSGKLKMGYREVSALRENAFFREGETARGHEFHYSEWIRAEVENSYAYLIQPRSSETPGPEGFSKNNLLASYVHLHFASNPNLARNFVTSCRKSFGSMA